LETVAGCLRELEKSLLCHECFIRDGIRKQSSLISDGLEPSSVLKNVPAAAVLISASGLGEPAGNGATRPEERPR
jgi:hypothetical protein